MNKNYKFKVNIIAVITMIIMLSGCFIFYSNATEVNTLPPPVVDTNTSNSGQSSDNTSTGENTGSNNENVGGSTENNGQNSSGSSTGGTNGGSTSSGNSGSSSNYSSGSSSNSGKNNTNKPSSNANLSNLGIRPHDFSGFTNSTTSYSVTVPADTESVEVYAQAQDSNATVTGTGTVNLQEGENTVNVVVTAEDGSTKTYTITITRETSENEETGTEIIEGEGLSKLNIQGAEMSPEFKTNVYEYTAKYIGEKTSLPIEVEATNETYKIEIVGNEDLKEGENLITILVSDSEGNNVATYQITVNKSLVDEEALAREQAEKEQKQKMIVGSIIAVVVVIAIIVFVIIRRRRNRAFAEEYSGVHFYGMNKDNDDIGIDDDFEEKPKALKKKRKFIEDEEIDVNDNYNEENINSDDYENEKDEYEEENQKIMSRLKVDEDEKARRERVKAKFLDGYSKSMTNREVSNKSRNYSKYDDESDLDDKAEAFASRVKNNSKGRRFK